MKVVKFWIGGNIIKRKENRTSQNYICVQQETSKRVDFLKHPKEYVVDQVQDEILDGEKIKYSISFFNHEGT